MKGIQIHRKHGEHLCYFLLEKRKICHIVSGVYLNQNQAFGSLDTDVEFFQQLVNIIHISVSIVVSDQRVNEILPFIILAATDHIQLLLPDKKIRDAFCQMSIFPYSIWFARNSDHSKKRLIMINGHIDTFLDSIEAVVRRDLDCIAGCSSLLTDFVKGSDSFRICACKNNT